MNENERRYEQQQRMREYYHQKEREETPWNIVRWCHAYMVETLLPYININNPCLVCLEVCRHLTNIAHTLAQYPQCNQR